MPILQKRSLVAGVLPTTASLLAGELGINVPDGRVFLRKSGSGSDTIQSAITTGAQNSGSVALTGSLSLYGTSGSVLSVASDTLEFNGDQMEFTGSFAVSGSMTVSGSLTVAGNFFGSVATSSFAFTASSANNFVVRGETTSSLLFVTGSSRFGSLSTDNHSFTGSASVSGSLNVLNGELSVLSSGVKVGNFITDAHTITGSFSVSGSINIDGGTY